MRAAVTDGCLARTHLVHRTRGNSRPPVRRESILVSSLNLLPGVEQFRSRSNMNSEVTGSNLDPGTKTPGLGSWFSSAPPNKLGRVSQIRPLPSPPTSTLSHSSLIILPFGAIQFELLIAWLKIRSTSKYRLGTSPLPSKSSRPCPHPRPHRHKQLSFYSGKRVACRAFHRMHKPTWTPMGPRPLTGFWQQK
jgi:hypothetical protein